MVVRYTRNTTPIARLLVYDLTECGGEDWTASRALCFGVIFFHCFVTQRRPNAACLKTKVGTLSPNRRRSLLQEPCNEVTLCVPILHILVSQTALLCKSVHINILSLNLYLSEILPKAQTMPHVKGNPGNHCRDCPPLPGSEDWSICENGSLSWSKGTWLLSDSSDTMSRPRLQAKVLG